MKCRTAMRDTYVKHTSAMRDGNWDEHAKTYGNCPRFVGSFQGRTEAVFSSAGVKAKKIFLKESYQFEVLNIVYL
jgi:hypothetical protein